MRLFSILTICALAVLSNACERHPLPGDPQPGVEHEKHEASSDGAKAAEHPAEHK